MDERIKIALGIIAAATLVVLVARADMMSGIHASADTVRDTNSSAAIGGAIPSGASEYVPGTSGPVE